jgi:hypothetical protein
MAAQWKTVDAKKVATEAFGLSLAPVARKSAITAPTGGATTDAEARTAINAIITVLEQFGFVTPN